MTNAQNAILNKKIVKTEIKSQKDFWTKNKAVIIKFTAFMLVVALLTAGSFGVSRAYEGKILPRVTVAGLKVGGKTPAQAEQLVKTYISQLNSKGPVISHQDKTFQPKLDEMGVTFDAKQVVQEAYRYGRPNSLKTRLKENSHILFSGHDVPLSPKINEQKMDEYLSQIATVVEAAPVDANLQIASGQINTIPSQDGRGLDKNKLKNDLAALINSGQTQGKILLETSVLKPAILADGTASAKAQAEKLMAAAPITVTFEDQVFTAGRAEIGSWLEFPKDGAKLKAQISESKLAGFVKFIASKIEIAKIDKEIMDGTGQVLNEGQDGRGADTKTLTAQIRQQVNSGQPNGQFSVSTFAIAKGETIIYPSAQPGRFPGRYLDVNLSEQLMRLFDGQTQVAEYTISTGKWSTPTPVGTRYIESKDPRAWSSKYGLYMPFWNSIGGGYGIHELPEWPNGAKEGESHLGTPVSHGCIRLGVGPAEMVYNWAAIGTPVYIHE